MLSTTIILFILCIILVVYFYALKKNNYWKRRGVSVVKSNFLFGAPFDFLIGRRSLEKIHEDIYKLCDPEKPYVGFYNALAPCLFVRDPELIHKILVTDFSHFHYRSTPLDFGGRLIYSLLGLQQEKWKHVRSKLTPTFSPNKIKKMQSLMEECGEMLVEQHFRPLAKAGQPIDAIEIASRYALDVIGKCAFGLHFNSLGESESLYRDIGKKVMASGVKNSLRLFLQFINPKLLKLFRMNIVSDEVEEFFFDLLRKAEKLRLTEKQHRGDLLQQMLDIKYEKENEVNHLFTDNHIASNMYLFYFAGHETSSNAITWALYELTLNPDIQEKLRQEIRETREANGGTLDYDVISNMKYMEMVVKETLRLHSPATFNIRLCTETYQVPGSSFEIKAGETILLSIAGIHKDEKYYSNPLKFDPERFSQDNIAGLNPYAYLPFGRGPRMCIGNYFAKFEIKMFLVSTLSRFKLLRCDKTEVPIKLKKGGIFHAPQNEVWLSVEEI